MRGPFLRAALEQLRDVGRRLSRMAVANGDVPVSLLRWEYLGLREEVDALERLH